ncbi:MAG: aldolase/citrate lyase family protein, partial [Anaerolineales bacterium]|nr:aldolase/citrate lyase family protein [Anaerolineales bacterium]
MFDKVTIGSWITIAHPAVAEIMASAGFDWLTVDLEHSAINIGQTEELIRVIDLKGIPAFVRLSSNNPEQIKRVMDSGAYGVIVPMVNSVGEAERAVDAVKYPPVGKRSFGLARAHGYGVRFSDYLVWEKSEAAIVIQIEHIDAVNNLEAIFSVSGIDAYFVGPYDLSGSLGVPGQFDHPEFLAAMARITDVAERVNMPGGVHIVEPDVELLEQSIERGARFI